MGQSQSGDSRAAPSAPTEPKPSKSRSRAIPRRGASQASRDGLDGNVLPADAQGGTLPEAVLVSAGPAPLPTATPQQPQLPHPHVRDSNSQSRQHVLSSSEPPFSQIQVSQRATITSERSAGMQRSDASEMGRGKQGHRYADDDEDRGDEEEEEEEDIDRELQELDELELQIMQLELQKEEQALRELKSKKKAGAQRQSGRGNELSGGSASRTREPSFGKVRGRGSSEASAFSGRGRPRGASSASHYNDDRGEEEDDEDEAQSDAPAFGYYNASGKWVSEISAASRKASYMLTRRHRHLAALNKVAATRAKLFGVDAAALIGASDSTFADSGATPAERLWRRDLARERAAGVGGASSEGALFELSRVDEYIQEQFAAHSDRLVGIMESLGDLEAGCAGGGQGLGSAGGGGGGGEGESRGTGDSLDDDGESALRRMEAEIAMLENTLEAESNQNELEVMLALRRVEDEIQMLEDRPETGATSASVSDDDGFVASQPLPRRGGGGGGRGRDAETSDEMVKGADARVPGGAASAFGNDGSHATRKDWVGNAPGNGSPHAAEAAQARGASNVRDASTRDPAPRSPASIELAERRLREMEQLEEDIARLEERLGDPALSEEEKLEIVTLLEKEMARLEAAMLAEELLSEEPEAEAAGSPGGLEAPGESLEAEKDADSPGAQVRKPAQPPNPLQATNPFEEELLQKQRENEALRAQRELEARRVEQQRAKEAAAAAAAAEAAAAAAAAAEKAKGAESETVAGAGAGGGAARGPETVSEPSIVRTSAGLTAAPVAAAASANSPSKDEGAGGAVSRKKLRHRQAHQRESIPTEGTPRLNEPPPRLFTTFAPRANFNLTGPASSPDRHVDGGGVGVSSESESESLSDDDLVHRERAVGRDVEAEQRRARQRERVRAALRARQRERERVLQELEESWANLTVTNDKQKGSRAPGISKGSRGAPPGSRAKRRGGTTAPQPTPEQKARHHRLVDALGKMK